MARIPATLLIGQLQARLGAIRLDGSPGAAALFDLVAPYATSNLDDALAKLIATTKQRVCLIVPAGIVRLPGSVVQGEATHYARYLKVELIYADKAYYKAEQVALVGGEKNIGVLEIAERVEDELDGVDLSPYGPVQWLAGDADMITHEKLPAGRVAWFQALLLPAGDNS